MKTRRGKNWLHAAHARRGALYGATLAATLVLAGCGNSAQQANKMTSFSAGANPQDQAELFSLPADQMSHIQVVTVAQVQLPRTLRLTGSVAYNGFKTTPVITQVGGPVSRIVVSPGDRVRAGQPMLYVASPDYSLTRSAYIKARDTLQLAEKQFARAQDLYAHHAIAQSDLEQSESARNQAQADLQSSEDALRVLGIGDPATVASAPPSPELPVVAPVDGEVVERLCSAGQLLQAGGTQCFTISDMNSVWILVNVYQNDLAFVHVGDPVAIENETYPGEVRGKIQYLAAALDPTTRTLQARIEAPNPGERLKRDMYVTAEVRAGTIANALVVPDASILRDDQNMPYVYLQTGTNQFAQQAVTLGESQNGQTQLATGVKTGDRVVATAVYSCNFRTRSSADERIRTR